MVNLAWAPNVGEHGLACGLEISRVLRKKIMKMEIK